MKINEFVKRELERLGYTKPGQPMNVETAAGLMRKAYLEGEFEGRKSTEEQCCSRCKDKFKSQSGVF